MRTKDEMMKYARGFAEAHFYSDDDTPWEPFEHWPEEQLEEQVDNLTMAVYHVMRWVQDGERT